MGRDTSPAYWAEFTNLQRVKQELIHSYLNGWFPKLGFWSGRVIYLDTHAGRGEHHGGQSGSPLVALETLLDHSFRDRILDRSEVRFVFIEHDAENVAILKGHLDALGGLPEKIRVTVSENDCYQQLEEILGTLDERGKKMAPAFAFVDPYGFKVPGETLARLLAAGRVELFLNIIWRELDMAIAQGQEHPDGGMAETLNLVFAGDGWKELDRDLDFDRRADQVIDLFREIHGARWVTSIRMLGNNQATRYILAHFTNHEAGRDLMKDCMWSVCPDGGYYARRSDNPDQTQLIEPEPNLEPLRLWLLGELEAQPRTWAQLNEKVRGELWRKTHLSKVIRDARNKGEILATKYGGRFSEKANPLFTLPEED